MIATVAKKKLTEKAKLRIAIAKDVLKIIPSVNVETGMYLYVSFENDGCKDARSFLKRKENLKGCAACALGCYMIAWVRRFNKEKVMNMDGMSRKSIVDRLKSVFSNHQMDLIEAAFERTCENDFIALDRDDVAEAALSFGHRFPDDRDRLRAIMENIVENGGDFIPLPEYK